MAISVDIELGYEFAVKAGFETVFDLLSDVPASAAHFPKLDQLVSQGKGVYRWEMQAVGTPQVSIQTVYASKYVSNRSKGTVVWTPVKGQGNAQVSGSWKIKKLKKHTALELWIQGNTQVPLPELMKPLVVAVVQPEFERLVEQYIDNLIREFGGEVPL